MMTLGTIEQEAAACRAAFATVEIGAFVRHYHHESEWLEILTEPAENRIAFILATKSPSEQPCRLQCFRPVTAPLPAELRKADAEWRKAYAEWQKACAEWQKTDTEWQKTYAEWWKAYAELQRAYAELQKACAEWPNLHAMLCDSDCPWDGKTIFPCRGDCASACPARY
jgi:hypothetical protein